MVEVLTPSLARWLRIAVHVWIILITIWLAGQTVETINRAIYFSRRRETPRSMSYEENARAADAAIARERAARAANWPDTEALQAFDKATAKGQP